jgi:hypothetical protein
MLSRPLQHICYAVHHTLYKKAILFMSDRQFSAKFNIITFNITIHRPHRRLYPQHTINCYGQLAVPSTASLYTFFCRPMSDISFSSSLDSSQIWPFPITAVCHTFRSATQLCRVQCGTVRQHCVLQNRQKGILWVEVECFCLCVLLFVCIWWQQRNDIFINVAENWALILVDIVSEK